VSNPFAAFAESTMSAPTKAKLRAAERRALKNLKKDDEAEAAAAREVIFKLWQEWRAERRAALLTGPYAVEVQKVIELLDAVTGVTSITSEVVPLIETGPWKAADPETRFQLLALVDLTEILARERAGAPPFDDPLPDEPPSTFLKIRSLLA
jgi:hypothetical protein